MPQTAVDALSTAQTLTTLLTVEGLLGGTISFILGVPALSGLKKAAGREARRVAIGADVLLVLLALAATVVWFTVAHDAWKGSSAQRVGLIGLLVGIWAPPAVITAAVALVRRPLTLGDPAMPDRHRRSEEHA